MMLVPEFPKIISSAVVPLQSRVVVGHSITAAQLVWSGYKNRNVKPTTDIIEICLNISLKDKHLKLYMLLTVLAVIILKTSEKNDIL